MCDNCKQAVYELEIQWGAGKFDYGRIKQILNQQEEEANV